MLPVSGCHPEVNVLFIGGYILKKVQENHGIDIISLFKLGNKELKVSTDHMILALDWLYTISAIDCKNNEVFLHEAY